jgi:hypothetical protein
MRSIIAIVILLCVIGVLLTPTVEDDVSGVFFPGIELRKDLSDGLVAPSIEISPCEGSRTVSSASPLVLYAIRC